MRLGKSGYLVVLFLVTGSVFLQAQSDRASLEQKRKEALAEIEQTNKILENNQKSQKQSLNQLNTLSSAMKARKNYVASLEEELVILNREIISREDSVAATRRRVKNIKDEYAASLVHAYKNKSGDHFLAYLFTSKDFTQAYRRKKYFEQFAGYRKSQADSAKVLETKLSVMIARLSAQKLEKENLQIAQKQESIKLEKEINRYNLVLKQLRSNATKLRRELAQKRTVANKLDSEIQKIIASEAKKLGGTKGNIYNKLSTVEQALSKNFKENKGKLPWPVDQGFVSGSFGLHAHPVLKGVMMPNNNGIDISTSPGSEVKAVFNGEVSRVFAILGANFAIIVRHGNFLTVYQNIVNIAVKQGDKVEVGQVLGKIFTDSGDQSSVLHFEIWEEATKLNPESWLKRRM
ncbi:MAG: peptidoglycan DD-metalloendopeptidase family protein [Bacteroidales bacterium]|nr:peptidoglycan DD-metalloendopeptidase family protein [Bacteroidales bacterium]